MSRLSVIDVSQLGTMQVLETLDSETTLDERMERVKELWVENDPPAAAEYDVEPLEFDPIKINQEAGTFFELLIRDRINQAARAVTLAFAVGTDLDAIASRYPGGVPRLDGETDNRYRRRIWLSPNVLSPHGIEESYVFWALTSQPTLRDATAITPKEGTGNIVITVLNEDEANPQPSTTVTIAVREYVHTEARKGVTDVVTVQPARLIPTKYRLKVWLYRGQDETIVLDKVRASLDELVEAQRWLGFDHTLMAINGACAVAGVQNVEIVEPAADIAASEQQFVQVTAIELTYMGRAE